MAHSLSHPMCRWYNLVRYDLFEEADFYGRPTFPLRSYKYNIIFDKIFMLVNQFLLLTFVRAGDTEVNRGSIRLRRRMVGRFLHIAGIHLASWCVGARERRVALLSQLSHFAKEHRYRINCTFKKGANVIRIDRITHEFNKLTADNIWQAACLFYFQLHSLYSSYSQHKHVINEDWLFWNGHVSHSTYARSRRAPGPTNVCSNRH